ncbi:oligosaccharide flippase family protein [Hahella sp. HN01]|uniref:oligosaccharide flippase family protein n=1 Tax=Hahella sp. HN01 TaxID=2847262 RepID=UPI001C1E8F92|nr:oligosaccharide flippase family protein [Hahella sp. HN01]
MLNHRAWKLMWVFVEKFSIVLISVFTFFIYAKLLGPGELGLALFALSIGQGIGVIYVAFLEDPLVRQNDVQAAHFDSAFWGGLVVSLVTAAAVMIGSLFASDDVRFQWLMFISVLHIPLLTTGHIYVADLRRKGKFKSLAKRTMGGKLIGAAVGLTLAWTGYGSFAIIVQSVIMALVSLVIMMRTSELHIGSQFRMSVFGELLSVGWPLALRGASWDAMNRGIAIILGLTAGSAAVGVYGLARRMIDMPRSAIYGGLLSYALPAFSRNQHDLPNLQKMFCFTTLTTCFIVLPMFVGLALVAPYLIPTLFGEEWRPAAPLIQILALVAAVGNTLIYVPTALTAVAKNKLTLPSELIAAGSALVFTAVMGAEMGALAGACAFIVHTLIASPAKVIGLKKALHIEPSEWLRTVYKSIVAATCMVGAVYAFVTYYSTLHPALLSATIIAIGMMTYLTMYTLLHKTWVSDLKAFLMKS